MNPARLRALVLAEWRGVPDQSFVGDTSKPVATLVSQLMGTLGLSERLREEEVSRAWREIVGDFVAAHSAPQKLQNGVLTVRVLQPTVHYELDRVFKPQLLAKLKKRFGTTTIRDLKFRIG